MNISNQKNQVLFLYGSSIIGLVLGMLVSVINTRYLTPEQYGDVRYVQNMISFISGLLLFGYFVSGSRLLALSQSEDYSRKIRGIMVAILGIAVVILMLCMLGFSGTNYFFSGKEELGLMFLVAVPVCGNVLMLNYINTTAQGDNHIGRISLARLLPAILYCIVAYPIFYYFGATGNLMLLLYNGTAIIVLLSIIFSTRPSFKSLGSSFKILNKENKTYGFNVYLGSVVGVSTQYIAGITLGQFCENNANVGFYTLALTLATPLSMLPSIIGTTYFKRFAREDRISKMVMSCSIAITALSLLCYWILIKYVVAIMYSEDYSSVSVIASYLAIATSIHGFGDMINRFLGAHGKGKDIRNSAFICGFIAVVGNILFVYLWDIKGAIFTRILLSLAYTGTMLYYYIKPSQENEYN